MFRFFTFHKPKQVGAGETDSECETMRHGGAQRDGADTRHESAQHRRPRADPRNTSFVELSDSSDSDCEDMLLVCGGVGRAGPAGGRGPVPGAKNTPAATGSAAARAGWPMRGRAAGPGGRARGGRAARPVPLAEPPAVALPSGRRGMPERSLVASTQRWVREAAARSATQHVTSEEAAHGAADSTGCAGDPGADAAAEEFRLARPSTPVHVIYRRERRLRIPIYKSAHGQANADAAGDSGRRSSECMTSCTKSVPALVSTPVSRDLWQGVRSADRCRDVGVQRTPPRSGRADRRTRRLGLFASTPRAIARVTYDFPEEIDTPTRSRSASAKPLDLGLDRRKSSAAICADAPLGIPILQLDGLKAKAGLLEEPPATREISPAGVASIASSPASSLREQAREDVIQMFSSPVKRHASNCWPRGQGHVSYEGDSYGMYSTPKRKRTSDTAFVPGVPAQDWGGKTLTIAEKLYSNRENHAVDGLNKRPISEGTKGLPIRHNASVASPLKVSTTKVLPSTEIAVSARLSESSKTPRKIATSGQNSELDTNQGKTVAISKRHPRARKETLLAKDGRAGFLLRPQLSPSRERRMWLKYREVPESSLPSLDLHITNNVATSTQNTAIEQSPRKKPKLSSHADEDDTDLSFSSDFEYLLEHSSKNKTNHQTVSQSTPYIAEGLTPGGLKAEKENTRYVSPRKDVHVKMECDGKNPNATLLEDECSFREHDAITRDTNSHLSVREFNTELYQHMDQDLPVDTDGPGNNSHDAPRHIRASTVETSPPPLSFPEETLNMLNAGPRPNFSSWPATKDFTGSLRAAGEYTATSVRIHSKAVTHDLKEAPIVQALKILPQELIREYTRFCQQLVVERKIDTLVFALRKLEQVAKRYSENENTTFPSDTHCTSYSQDYVTIRAILEQHMQDARAALVEMGARENTTSTTSEKVEDTYYLDILGKFYEVLGEDQASNECPAASKHKKVTSKVCLRPRLIPLKRGDRLPSSLDGRQLSALLSRGAYAGNPKENTSKYTHQHQYSLAIGDARSAVSPAAHEQIPAKKVRKLGREQILPLSVLAGKLDDVLEESLQIKFHMLQKLDKKGVISIIQEGICGHTALGMDPLVSVSNNICSAHNYDSSAVVFFQNTSSVQILPLGFPEHALPVGDNSRGSLFSADDNRHSTECAGYQATYGTQEALITEIDDDAFDFREIDVPNCEIVLERCSHNKTLSDLFETGFQTLGAEIVTNPEWKKETSQPCIQFYNGTQLHLMTYKMALQRIPSLKLDPSVLLLLDACNCKGEAPLIEDAPEKQSTTAQPTLASEPTLQPPAMLPATVNSEKPLNHTAEPGPEPVVPDINTLQSYIQTCTAWVDPFHRCVLPELAVEAMTVLRTVGAVIEYDNSALHSASNTNDGIIVRSPDKEEVWTYRDAYEYLKRFPIDLDTYYSLLLQYESGVPEASPVTDNNKPDEAAACNRLPPGQDTAKMSAMVAALSSEVIADQLQLASVKGQLLFAQQQLAAKDKQIKLLLAKLEEEMDSNRKKDELIIKLKGK
ncbi:AGR188Wp [Eremothecium gossypii ATCC 10895]|uniref:AGR188Wp n=1 Tax=Eremothecium gossypii (strain ATCC 10895 / CBS 109.51 / FGSC 9923 / NRRL Y-1056) TaxID=284811 RepID=Q74ZW1_EREGS|nr:AGR188Wp [Eremothecium gossypii ATCC 10895]AAS54678.2 AGR188Wp [Eremothecium gossypii ATCC 10895]